MATSLKSEIPEALTGVLPYDLSNHQVHQKETVLVSRAKSYSNHLTTFPINDLSPPPSVLTIMHAPMHTLWLL